MKKEKIYVYNRIMILLTNISKRYKKKKPKALDHFSLNIKNKDFIVLLGPNGAGKTTLLKIICGLIAKYEGKMKSEGKVMFVPEKITFPWGMTAKKFFRGLSILSPLSKKDFHKQLHVLMKSLKVETFYKSKLSSLSSGQKKKMFLIQGLLFDSKTIIMDEPSANLDPIARKDLWLILKKLNKEGKTILIASHNVYEIERQAKRYVIINKGKKIASGNISALKTTLEDTYIKGVTNSEQNN